MMGSSRGGSETFLAGSIEGAYGVALSEGREDKEVPLVERQRKTSSRRAGVGLPLNSRSDFSPRLRPDRGDADAISVPRGRH